jgi:hypothetical protein
MGNEQKLGEFLGVGCEYACLCVGGEDVGVLLGQIAVLGFMYELRFTLYRIKLFFHSQQAIYLLHRQWNSMK